MAPGSGWGPTSFGAMLRAFRMRMNLTQEELARRAGLSPKAIGALERGERLVPHPSTLRALCTALELDGDDRTALSASAHGPATGTPAHDQRAAAWELYVELVTRIAVVELPADQGLLRDALTSLHSLFDITRQILRRQGPSSVGILALAVLNDAIRPFLAEWHPALLDHESGRLAGVSPAAHEQAWERSAELREALARLRANLEVHARQLGSVAGVHDGL